MNWEIRFLPEAEDDLASLNQSVRPEVLKGIRKVAQNPGYPDGYGKPLGNFAGSKLAGLYKIKFKKAGLRVVYALQRVEGKDDRRHHFRPRRRFCVLRSGKTEKEARSVRIDHFRSGQTSSIKTRRGSFFLHSRFALHARMRRKPSMSVRSISSNFQPDSMRAL